MSESSNNPRGFCTNCGAEVREGNTFCHVCGASLEAASPQPDQPEPSPTPSSGNVRARLSDALGHAVDWFWSLPTLIKLAIVAVVVLIVGIFLSPVLAFVFAVVAVGAIIYAVFQLRRRRPSALPFGIAATSVVLFLIFIGVGSLIYGGEGGNDTQTGGGNQGGEGEQQTPDIDINEISTPLAEDDGGEMIDIYVVDRSYGNLPGSAADPYLFVPGYVFVLTEEDYYYHVEGLVGQEIISGDVGPGGVLYVGASEYGDIAGSLNDFRYACSYDSGDPRGAEVAIPEACGFSIETN